MLTSARDGTKYMLRKWYTGRECDVKKEQDILESVRNLALLHQHLKWRDMCSIEKAAILRPPVGRHLKEVYTCHNRELKKVRSYIRSRVHKSDFEYLYLENFEHIYHLAERITDRLAASEYGGLYRENVEAGAVIHGDYNYHNILHAGSGIATTNFDQFQIDVQAQDLYYFLRKVMEKNQWRESLGLAMLEAYRCIRPLDEREMEYIALSLAYPEKFWKAANTYYHRNKAWLPRKNVDKLQLTVEQIEIKLQFLKNLFSFQL